MGARAVAIALLPLVAAPLPARADCKPTAIAHGDPALVQTVVARLTASGIATTSTSGCPSVQFQIDARGSRVHLAMTDAYDRSSERDVQDVATAAAIVESWTRQEIEAGSLPATAVPTVSARRFDLSAAVAPAVGSDRSTWLGGSLAACTHLGPTCAGATLRAEADTRASGYSSTIDQTSYALSAFATIDLPRNLGGFVIAPGIGVGYGWMHVVTHHHDAMNNVIDVPTSDHQLQTAAHVAVSRPFGRFSAFADLWADLRAARSDSQFGPTASLYLAFGVSIEVP